MANRNVTVLVSGEYADILRELCRENQTTAEEIVAAAIAYWSENRPDELTTLFTQNGQHDARTA